MWRWPLGGRKAQQGRIRLIPSTIPPLVFPIRLQRADVLAEFLRQAFLDRLTYDVEQMVAAGLSEEDVETFRGLAIASYGEAAKECVIFTAANAGPLRFPLVGNTDGTVH